MSNIRQIMAECGCQHTQCETLGYCMAARIIELEAEVTDMQEGLTTVYWSGYEDGKKAMEAKLAKVKASFRRNMMQAYPAYTHEQFDKDYEEMMGGKDER